MPHEIRLLILRERYCCIRLKAITSDFQRVHPDASEPTSRLDSRPVAAVYNLSVMQVHGHIQPPPHRLDATFAALADPTRRAILARLASGEASVTELAEPFAVSQPAISKHLKVLERAGLISTGRDAQRRPRRLEAAPLAEVNEWVEDYRRFWEENFLRLDALLDELKTAEKKRRGTKRKGR
jgi:DNA-binding transcriptional ArsR family regulator